MGGGDPPPELVRIRMRRVLWQQFGVQLEFAEDHWSQQEWNDVITILNFEGSKAEADQKRAQAQPKPQPGFPR